MYCETSMLTCLELSVHMMFDMLSIPLSITSVVSSCLKFHKCVFFYPTFPVNVGFRL